MTSKQDIRAELIDVADAIGSARAALTQNQIVDMTEIPQRMRNIASAITDLAPEDAIELRPSLTSLLADFKGFAEELRTKINEIQTVSGSAVDSAATGKSGG